MAIMIHYGRRSDWGHTIWEDPVIVEDEAAAVKYTTEKTMEVIRHAVDHGYTIEWISEDLIGTGKIFKEVPKSNMALPVIEHYLGAEIYRGPSKEDFE